MRSSVSYILSSSTSEPNMSRPDYEQYSHDHAALLILVRHLGTELKPKSFLKFFERISKLNRLKVTDSVGVIRPLLLRFVKEYPVENNDWGDFQTHRRLLGLISLGKYNTQVELNELCRLHESLKVKYSSSLYDSRCVFFGPTKEEAEEGSKTASSDDSSPISTSGSSPSELEAADAEHASVRKFSTPSNFKTRALFYREDGPCVDLEMQLTELVNGLFWVLESKRLDRSQTQRDKCEKGLMSSSNSVSSSSSGSTTAYGVANGGLPVAPFEYRDLVGIDMESRNSRRRYAGRWSKHLGDLCLQAGLVDDALAHYKSAADTLNAVNDYLWLGAALEGQCTASALVYFPDLQRHSQLHRNASLQVPLKKEHGVATNSCTTSPRKSLSPIQSSETSNGAGRKPPQIHLLTRDDICKKYREVLIYYSKYQNAGIVETEASFKAARIAIVQCLPLQVAGFLQNVLFINLTLSETEKIDRFEMLSELYSQIGFLRKASHFKRLAAARFVSQQNPSPNWGRCYGLMLHSLDGYRLHLEPTEMLDREQGWPLLQVQLLKELVVAAKRMGHSALATRHMTFLLQTMWPNLTAAERKEHTIQLQSLTAQCEGAPVPLVLDSGDIIPPANLTNIPKCVNYVPQNLPSHMQPKSLVQLRKAATTMGPFLFTPSHFGINTTDSGRRRGTGGSGSSATDHDKVDFYWTQNDICSVVLQLRNPLPFELHVTDMQLLTSGVVFEAEPQSTVLNAFSEASVTLRGIPREPTGNLLLHGYSTHALGVKSNCRLRHVEGCPPNFDVPIVASMPLIQVEVSINGAETASELQGSTCSVNDDTSVVFNLCLYHGQRTECTVTVKNISDVPVEWLEVFLENSNSTSGTVSIPINDHVSMEWSSANIESQLPLQPHQSASFMLYVCHDVDTFLTHNQPMLHSAGVAPSVALSSCTTTQQNSFMGRPSLVSEPLTSSSGPFSIHSVTPQASLLGGSLTPRLHSPTPQLHVPPPFHRTQATGSVRSSTQSHSSGSMTTSCQPNTMSSTAGNVLDTQLIFRYGGGDSWHDPKQYCRSCVLNMTVELLHSLQVTNWDVLPGESVTQFYLVLDVVNLTNHEMELVYTDSKRMMIEAEEVVRVPVPVRRCPLSKFETNTAQLTMERICAEHIANQVDLKWQLIGICDVNGQASLKGITLSTNMLDEVRMSPLTWEVLINEEVVRAQEDFECTTGDMCHISVVVTNTLDRVLNQVTLSVQFYQDYENGKCNYRMDTRLAIAGTNKKYLASLEPQKDVRHDCTVMFFTPGLYKVDLQCCTPDSCHYQQTECNVTLDAGSLASPLHIWRFTPPVNVTVSG